jgi:hypothetical protein
VLVGQQISAEPDVMAKIGIDLRDQELFSIKGIIDILTISRAVRLPFDQRPSFEKLLEYLEVPFQNDAHFTLRTLLIPAFMAFRKMELYESS